MRLAEHLTALRAWYQQCLPGRGKPDVLRFRDCRDARVYGHPCTIMSTLPPPPPFFFPPSASCALSETRLNILNPCRSAPPAFCEKNYLETVWGNVCRSIMKELTRRTDRSSRSSRSLPAVVICCAGSVRYRSNPGNMC